jgi:hypothetical protein
MGLEGFVAAIDERIGADPRGNADGECTVELQHLANRFEALGRHQPPAHRGAAPGPRTA